MEPAAVALQLLPLGLDDAPWRALDEALVGQHAPGPGDLAAEPLELGLEVAAVGLRALGLDDRLEDPPLLLAEVDERAAAAEDPRGVLDAVEQIGRASCRERV